jgi:hypothetical protein
VANSRNSCCFDHGLVADMAFSPFFVFSFFLQTSSLVLLCHIIRPTLVAFLSLLMLHVLPEDFDGQGCMVFSMHAAKN